MEVKIWVEIRVQDPGYGGEGSETEAASWLKENLCIMFDCVCFVRLFLLGFMCLAGFTGRFMRYRSKRKG